METAPIYERLKARVRERLKDIDGCGKESTGHIKRSVSHVFIHFSSSFLSSLSLSLYIGALWNEQKHAINYLHQKFNIYGSGRIPSLLTLEESALTNRYIPIRLAHYGQLVMFYCIVHTHAIYCVLHLVLVTLMWIFEIVRWLNVLFECVVIIGKGSRAYAIKGVS